MGSAPWKNLQANEVPADPWQWFNGQKKSLCWIFRTLGKVAGFWLMLHMSKWKALGMFDLFLWIYVHQLD